MTWGLARITSRPRGLAYGGGGISAAAVLQRRDPFQHLANLPGILVGRLLRTAVTHRLQASEQPQFL